MLYQQVIPHYRKHLIESLSEEGSYDFFLVADVQSNSSLLKPAALELGPRFLEAETKKLCLATHTLSWQPKVFTHLRTIRPDVIIALGNPNSITSWGILLYGFLTRTRVLLWTHGLLRSESGLKWWLRKLFYTFADGLLLYGEKAKDLLIGKGVNARKLFVIYNSLNFKEQQRHLTDISKDEVAAFKARSGIVDGDRLVVFSGRLQANKKLSYLVNAVGILRQRNRVVHIAFIGDGEESSALAELAKRVGIFSQVHFLGETYDERFLAKVFVGSDLSVVPSGAGLSVMHALGYGVPVLLHDRPEEHFPEWEAVREGETGFFYRYGDVNDMADKMETALFPTAQKERMTDACLGMIRDRYSTDTHVGAIISAINQIVVQER